jgi:two-component system OmpR family sensor kinase
MDRSRAPRPDCENDRLLLMLGRLLELPATDFQSALAQAAQLVAEALAADKVDAFIHEPANDTLVAIGVSETPMGRHQRAIGLDRLPLANGGSSVEVFRSGTAYRTGHADQEPAELPGVKGALGVRSTIAVPLQVGSASRGVLQAASATPDFFAERDLQFLEAVARWVGVVAHRAELAERATAEAAAQARRVAAEELVMILAHDLRNYLTPIQGRINAIQRRAYRENRPDYLGDANMLADSVDRLNDLIGDLLDVARLEQGLFSVQPRAMDLVELARETAAELGGTDDRILVQSPEQLVISADPDRVRQALANLIANALKHSPDDVPVTVSVAGEERRPGQWAVVAVSDQGPGIPEHLLPRLFTRFAIGPGSTGLGLGLYLAHSIAAAHGGSLTVESAPGQGATFRLALPVQPG